MINIPKKPAPTYLVTLGIPAAILFTIFSFRRIGFNLQDFRENLANRAIVTDPLFNPKWQWAWENTADALLETVQIAILASCLLYTSPSPRDVNRSRMPSSA